jgi:hypothetical protein
MRAGAGVSNRRRMLRGGYRRSTVYTVQPQIEWGGTYGLLMFSRRTRLARAA